MALSYMFSSLSSNVKDFLSVAIVITIIEIAIILLYYELFPRLLLLRKDWKVKKIDASNLLSPFEEEGIKIKGVYLVSPVAVKVVRLSKSAIFTRKEVITRRMNALAAGLSKKYIFITEDALSGLEEKEIRGIFAHEMGHHVHGHLIKVSVLSLVYLLSLAYFGNAIKYNFIDLSQPIFEFCSGFSGLLYFLIIAKMLRRFERQADAYAKEKGYGPYLATALQKIAEYNKTPLENGILGKLFCFHPSAMSRIKMLLQGTDSESRYRCG